MRIGSEDAGDGNTDITQSFEWFDEDAAGQVREEVKRNKLLALLKAAKDDKCLVFTATRKGCGELATWLDQRFVKAVAMHGDLRQEDRTKALRDFKTGVRTVLVATDIAARGIDVQNVKLVVQFDPAVSAEDYTHRIGRTGRAGHTGRAVLFIGRNDVRAGKDARAVLEAQGADVPEDVEALAERRIENWKERSKAKYFRPDVVVGTYVTKADKKKKKQAARDEKAKGKEADKGVQEEKIAKKAPKGVHEVTEAPEEKRKGKKRKGGDLETPKKKAKKSEKAEKKVKKA